MNTARIVTAGILMSVLMLTVSTPSSAEDLYFAPTSDASSWQVAWSQGGTEGAYESFPTSGFAEATPISWRSGWIANNSSGSNGGVGRWTYFIFRQEFDLTGFDPSTANLQFKWAADDSGEIYADRGSWIPKLRLNSGEFMNYPGSTPSHRIPTYGLSAPVELTSGFVAGKNTIDFYVEGNGQTDGFALETIEFTADSMVVTPEPVSLVLFGLGGGAMLLRRRMK